MLGFKALLAQLFNLFGFALQLFSDGHLLLAHHALMSSSVALRLATVLFLIQHGEVAPNVEGRDE